jgi:uncharacterized protein YraI
MKRLKLIGRCAPLLAALALLAGCTAPPTSTPTTVAVLPTVAVVVAARTAPPATRTATAEPATATVAPSPTSAATSAATAPTPQSQANTLTASQNINLRSGPGINYDLVGNLLANSTAEVTGRDASGSWLVVEVNGRQSWVARAFVAFDGNVNALPVVAAPPTPRRPTSLPTASVVTPPPAVGGARGITGSLQMCGGKTTFAAGVERICFIETIRNPTSATVQYGIIGVLAMNTATGATQFQSSWSAFTGPLAIDPGCTGPTDKCNGPWEDGMYIATPGTYRLTLNMCFTTTIEGCASGGDWVTLTPGIDIVVQ